MADNMQLVITANVSQATTALNQTQKALANTAVTALRADSSLQRFSTGSNQAAQALTNVGRVAQDLPFGFIGIQNNLNPLLESFTRLKTETGSTGGALKALAGSLVGAGGIGLALSAVSAAILIYQNGIAGFNKKTKEATDSTKAYKDELQGIFQEVGKEAEGILSLIAVLKSETETRDRKLDAIKQLQKAQTEIFAGLKLEEGAVIGVDNAYKNYIATLQNLATVRVLQARLDKEVARLIELEGTAKTKSEKGNRALTNFYLDVDEKGNKAASAVRRMTVNFAQSLDPIVATKGKIEELIAKIAEFSNGVKVINGTDKIKKSAETVNDVLAKLAREISFLNEKELQLGTNEAKAKISAIESAIEQLVKQFKVDPKDTIIQKLFGQVNDLNFSQFQKDLNVQARKLRLDPVPLPVEPYIDIGKFDPFPNRDQPVFGTKSKEDAFKFLDDLNARVKFTQETFASVFTSLGEGIGKSISEGTNVLQGALEGILHIMGKFLVQMGEAAILGSSLAIAIKNLFKNPLTGLVAGIAAVAIGTVLSSIQLPAFANGVDNFSGGMAVVGERGPEIVRLPRGSDVIPNHQLGGVSAGSPLVMIADTRISGNDIVISYQRASKTISRNG